MLVKVEYIQEGEKRGEPENICEDSTKPVKITQERKSLDKGGQKN